MAKIPCVLYDDPLRGYPEWYARDAVPNITHYEDGQRGPSAPRNETHFELEASIEGRD